jgi:hypothetical protein
VIRRVRVDLPQFVGVDRALEDGDAAAFPNVVVAVQVRLFQVLHFLPEHVGKPGVVPPVDLYDLRARRRLQDETLVRVVRRELWIEAYPDLRSFFSDRRDQRTPARLRNRLRFFDPDDVAALNGLDLYRLPAGKAPAASPETPLLSKRILLRRVYTATIRSGV